MCIASPTPLTNMLCVCVCEQLAHAKLYPAVQLEQVWAKGQLRLLMRPALTWGLPGSL
jgi:hypothetical protein